MKKHVRLFVVLGGMLFLSMSLFAEPVMKVANMEYDFGKIQEKGGKVTGVFVFQNASNEELIISDVRTTCACVEQYCSATSIAPWQNAYIVATYNPNGRPGRFQKSIQVSNNSAESMITLTIKGQVIR